MAKAQGYLRDATGSLITGRLHFYKKNADSKAHIAILHEDEELGIVGPGTDTYTYTGKMCEAVSGDKLGWFDLPGGIEPGEYALHVHRVEQGVLKKYWAWPLIVKEDSKPVDIYVGGHVDSGPGPTPLPGNFPAITPLNKQFTKGTFTAAISYYGAVGAPIDRVKRDLTKARQAGFGNARIWIDWPDNRAPNSSCMNSNGSFIEDKAKHVDQILDFMASIGMSADLTMRAAKYDFVKVSGEGYDIPGHLKAVENVLKRWGKHPALRILDMANEAEVLGASPGSGSPGNGHVSPARFDELMNKAKSIPHTCLVGVSISGGGEFKDVIRNHYTTNGSDNHPAGMFRDDVPEILLPHWPRVPGWGAKEGPNVVKLSSVSKLKGIPVYNQEPARNNYNGQNWPVSEFENAFKSSKAAGAVGECFHTGAGFDLSQKDMFDKFDNTERQIIANVYGWIK